MKKRSFAVILIVLSIVLVTSLTACSGLFGSDSRYFIDIGEVDDYGVASIVANNTITSCVRVIADYKRGSEVISTTAASGFVITEDGYVLTNRHCVIQYYMSGTDTPKDNGLIVDTLMDAKYTIVLANNRMFTDDENYKVELVGYSSTTDIAVLKISKKSNNIMVQEPKFDMPLVLETKEELFYGQRAYTIGNPENMGLMMSELMIASPSIRFRRTSDDGFTVIEDAFDSIILDGNINHGNSGGPLLNVHSRVTGILYARIDGKKNENDKADAYGLGCAISTSEIIKFLDSIKGVKIDYKTTPKSA